MLLSRTLKFYKKPAVRRALVRHAKDKEVAVRYQDYFGKRPQSLEYEDDVLELAKNGAVSFHCSEERWTNPLSLRTGISKAEMDDMRTGWDLILDIDCDHYPYSRLAAHHLVEIIKEHGITSVSAKFSGNKGFHIAVPFEAFPERIQGRVTKQLFPDAPRRIAEYLKHRLNPPLSQSIIQEEKQDLQVIADNAGIDPGDLVMDDEQTLKVDEFLEIDTILIASRHLYRMPYSFHEKSGLVSLPVPHEEILGFERLHAKPHNADFQTVFLNRDRAKKGEAERLVIQSYDYKPSHEDPETTHESDYEPPEDAVATKYFPPCIQSMREGMEDGRKRTLFTLINFYRSVGWSLPQIREEIREWNDRNPAPLRETTIQSQLKQAQKKPEIIPPHNCPHAGKSYYKDLGVCNPDNFCQKIKNPAQYARYKSEISEE